MTALPAISHLQYLALAILRDARGGALSADALRRAFLSYGAGNRSSPAFFQFMRRLDDWAFISRTRKVGASKRVEVSYSLTPAGLEAVQTARAFYAAKRYEENK